MDWRHSKNSFSTGLEVCNLKDNRTCFHDKYAAEFAQEYGTYWVRKLIKEEELKLAKKSDQ